MSKNAATTIVIHKMDGKKLSILKNLSKSPVSKTNTSQMELNVFLRLTGLVNISP